MNLAVGVSFLYRIDKDEDGNNKKAELVTDCDEIKSFLDAHPEGEAGNVGDSYYYITTVKPDNSALDSMLNRAFGKPTEVHEISGLDGGPLDLAIRMVSS